MPPAKPLQEKNDADGNEVWDAPSYQKDEKRVVFESEPIDF